MIREMLDKHEERMDETVRSLPMSQKIQREVKNTIAELKNTLEKNSSRLDNIEEGIIELEDKTVEITQANQKKELKQRRIA